jgi:hypothetical protein
MPRSGSATLCAPQIMVEDPGFELVREAWSGLPAEARQEILLVVMRHTVGRN